MSNMGQFGNKNGPWSRSDSSMNQGNSLMNQGNLGNLNNQGLVQFQQQHPQVFQNAIGLQQQNLGLGLQQIANNAMGAASLGSQLASNSLFQQVGAVTYPNSRSLNPRAFQTQNLGSLPTMQNNSNTGIKQRVFTGTVTTVHDNFGFIDDEVFFPRNVCIKGSNPMVGDRVLVEAAFNSTTPFKWNASRVQVLPANQQSPQQSMHHSGGGSHKGFSGGNSYSAVPPPLESINTGNFGGRNNRPKASQGGRGRERSRERDRDDDEIERKRRREERMREREKEEKNSPTRKRSWSPKPARRRVRPAPRYLVQIPKIPLNLPEADVSELRRKYSNLYVPSDFFFSHIRWIDAFPPYKPYAINKACSFHIINKELQPVAENTAVLEPPDADYTFSAKVMLMSIPGMDDVYQKCCSMAEDKDKENSETRDCVHPTRLINFLVGLRGKNETMAIGGPWSPSLDGESPDKDPAVLIRTAIRTCKALTGIDLSNCTQWYRFVELYYRRNDSTHKGKSVPARVETVVIYLPDVWSCLPTRLEWENLQQIYRKHLEALLKSSEQETGDDASATDEKEEDNSGDNRLVPTHYSQLDPKTMTVGALRTELKARIMNARGLKSQLAARLVKVLKEEAKKSEEKGDAADANGEKGDEAEASGEAVQEEKKAEVEEQKLGKRERALLEKRFRLPDNPQLIVHPSKTAKSGKFDCTTMSLSLLLDYRPEDTKEHSFEVSLFAELFNEMLMRDFGFNIFKALYKAPEKPKEKEKDDKKKKDDDKKKDKKDEDKKDDKKNDEDKTKKDKNEEKGKKSAEESGDEDDTEEGSDKKSTKKDKHKKERVKMYTKDRNLLLSFAYFDTTHCGYILEKDIEELLYTLGLDLSRAQVRKLLAKVIMRDAWHYRKLTDKPKDEVVTDDNIEDKMEDLEEMSNVNKKLLPVFKEGGRPTKRLESAQGSGSGAATSDEGLVTFRGAVVDISKLLSHLERSEKARLETESRLVEFKTENNKLQEKYHKSHSTIKHLNSEMKDYKDKLRSTEDSLSRVSSQSKVFQTLLVDIQSQIEPVLHRASQKEQERERKHEEKLRLEKEREAKRSANGESKNDNKSSSHEDTKTESKAEVKKDAKIETKNEIKSEAKAETKMETDNAEAAEVVKKEN